MKLTDFLEDIGRPIAYYPSMRKITGSTNATVLLCQFIYWRGKEADPDGWLLKTSDEIEGETGLSYDEQKTARKQLKDAGFLEEHYARLDHQMKYRLDLNAINEAWAPWQSPVPEHGNATLGKAESGDSLNSNTENTTENKPKGDLLDGEIHYNLKPNSIRQAIKEHFRLNVNWETKTARQWMEWAVSENITPDQIARAADLWRSSKTFNWQTPTLKGIFEKWAMLNEPQAKQNDRTSMLRTIQ